MMTEKNAIDMCLLELIGVHLKKSNLDINENIDKQLIQDADTIIDNLNENDGNTIKKYIDSLIEIMALEEMCLYKAGIEDGVRLLAWITKVCSEDT